MSTFTLNSITVQGLNVIAKLVAGSTLQFTRIAVGDGAMPSDKTPLTVTDLTNKLFDVDINSVENNGNGSATVTGVFSNADKETGFFYRELGLYAKDPDTQAEFLYCYGNAAADAEWINPSGASSVIEKEVKIVTLIGNAETVKAEIKSGIYATKEEVEAALAVKADLDATAEDGGRVLASQMRFDDTQTLYVDAAAAEGGDGSEAKPFKTIQAAINARYKGAAVIYVRIKAGTYAESISVPRSPGTTWRFMREGTGTVNINNAVIDNCSYVYFDNLTFNGPTGDNSTIIYVANTPAFNFNAVTINGASNATGVNFSTSRGIMRNSSINNCGLAIAATDGAYIDLKNNGGTGNTRAFQADGSVIICDYYVPAATTPYEKVNGGVISVQGGTSSFPSNYSQLYNLGDFSDAQALKTAILAEFGSLGIGESRACWFANNITGGFGIFETGQRMQCTIIKSTNNGSGYGTVIFNSHHNAAMAYMQIQDGAFAQATPVKFISSNDLATTSDPGVVLLADETAEKNPTAARALAPANVYKLCNFRIISTAYETGDVVACAYHADLQLKCTQAGTTSADPLDTSGAYAGQEITDGGVKWFVEALGNVKTVNGKTPDASGNIDINRKFYNSLASLGLSYQTVTFADIINALPVNSTLTFYVDVVTSQPNYAPNLQIPASGLVIVVKGSSNTVPTLFYLNPIVKGYTSYTGQYTTYNDNGFSGWQPMVLSVNAIKPNINGNVTLPIDTYALWRWSGNGITINGFTVTFTNGFKMAIWYMLFPAQTNQITVNFLTPFNAPPCVYGSITVKNASIHLIPNVSNITTTSVTCITNNVSSDPTSTYWVAMGYDA